MGTSSVEVGRPPPIRIAALSDIGKLRARQEDACAEFTDEEGWHLLVVADGMGGQVGGEEASRAAVSAIGEIFAGCRRRDGELLRRALRAANERVLDLAAERPELRGMGTTAVALLARAGGSAWVAHVGDSRAYRLRGRRLLGLTEDHSWVIREVQSGRLSRSEAALHPHRSVLLRCLGGEPVVDADVVEVSARPGDRFLLCSDGLWDAVAPDEIARIVRQNEPAACVHALVDLANARGGRDNVTVQVAVLPGSSRRTFWMLAVGACGVVATVAVWRACSVG